MIFTFYNLLTVNDCSYCKQAFWTYVVPPLLLSIFTYSTCLLLPHCLIKYFLLQRYSSSCTFSKAVLNGTCYFRGEYIEMFWTLRLHKNPSKNFISLLTIFLGVCLSDRQVVRIFTVYSYIIYSCIQFTSLLKNHYHDQC